MNTRRPKPRKQQQRAAETRSAILKAALDEFAAKGFDGATTRGIAEQAEVNHTVITHHFGNKEDLWKATASYVFSLYNQRTSARIANFEDAEEETLVRLLLREFILFSAEIPQFNLFMTQASQAGGDRLSWLVENFIEPGSRNEMAVLAAAQRHNLLGIGDINYLRLLFIGAATSIFTWSNIYTQLSGEDPFAEDVVERHVDNVLNLFQVD